MASLLKNLVEVEMEADAHDFSKFSNFTLRISVSDCVSAGFSLIFSENVEAFHHQPRAESRFRQGLQSIIFKGGPALSRCLSTE